MEPVKTFEVILVITGVNVWFIVTTPGWLSGIVLNVGCLDLLANNYFAASIVDLTIKEIVKYTTPVVVCLAINVQTAMAVLVVIELVEIVNTRDVANTLYITMFYAFPVILCHWFTDTFITIGIVIGLNILYLWQRENVEAVGTRL